MLDDPLPEVERTRSERMITFLIGSWGLDIHFDDWLNI